MVAAEVVQMTVEWTCGISEDENFEMWLLYCSEESELMQEPRGMNIPDRKIA